MGPDSPPSPGMKLSLSSSLLQISPGDVPADAVVAGEGVVGDPVVGVDEGGGLGHGALILLRGELLDWLGWSDLGRRGSSHVFRAETGHPELLLTA